MQAIGDIAFIGEADPRTLDQVKADALSALQIYKARALAAMQYSYNGVTYTVTLDVQDQIDVDKKIQMLTATGAGATTLWEVVDNVFLTWAVSDLEALEGAGLTYVDTVYANVANLSAQIAAASDAAAVQAIDLTAGFPT
jgi:hypothetical protein